jgi:hypothetical protein
MEPVTQRESEYAMNQSVHSNAGSFFGDIMQGLAEIVSPHNAQGIR